MPGINKYQLSEAFQSVAGEVAIPGTEISSGRAVVLHLLVGADSADNLRVLRSATDLSGEHRRRVLETGIREGVPFVVTAALPGGSSLRDWLTWIAGELTIERPTTALNTSIRDPGLDKPQASKSGHVAKADREFRQLPAQPSDTQLTTNVSETTSAGALGSPPAPLVQATIPPAPTPPVSPARTPEPGEFTRFIIQSSCEGPASSFTEGDPDRPTLPGAMSDPAKTPAQTAIPAASASPISTSEAPRPGEFTRFVIQSADSPPTTNVPASPVTPNSTSAELPIRWAKNLANESTVPAVTGPVSTEPGEFTRNFQSEPKLKREVSAPAQPALERGEQGSPAAEKSSFAAVGPGEFTKAMQSPLLAEPFWSSHPQPAARQPPSEFTRMMQVRSEEPDQPPSRQDPRPVEPNAFPWKPEQSVGEYTKIFESGQAREDQFPHSPAPVMPVSSGEGSTGVLSNPAPRAAPVAVGPSEYTQMVSAAKSPPSAAGPQRKVRPTPPKASAGPLIIIMIIVGISVLVALILFAVFAMHR
jgi:hypothetical protein